MYERNEMLMELISRLPRLETLILCDTGVFLSDDILHHLPKSLLEISFTMGTLCEPISFDAFQTFIQTMRERTCLRTVEFRLLGEEAMWARIEKRWASFARHNKRKYVHVMFPKRGEEQTLPNWARLDTSAF
jgi:hypothetical protein